MAVTLTRPLQGVGMVLVGGLSVQIGGALAVLLFTLIDPLGLASLRLLVAAIILMAVCRPKLRGLHRADWALLVAFGVSMAAMLALMYSAIQRIPLGPAVTLDVLGPLTLSVVTSRRAVGWLWAGLAAGGVLLLGKDGFDDLDALGAVLALLAGAVWAVYIVLSSRSAQRFPKADGLAIAMAVAAVVSLPLGLASDAGALVDPRDVALVAAVAAVSTVVPYTMDNLALRRLPESTFGILMSLDPAIAAAAGFVILGQHLTPAQLLAVVLVMIASVGGVATGARTAEPQPRDRSAASASV